MCNTSGTFSRFPQLPPVTPRGFYFCFFVLLLIYTKCNLFMDLIASFSTSSHDFPRHTWISIPLLALLLPCFFFFFTAGVFLGLHYKFSFLHHSFTLLMLNLPLGQRCTPEFPRREVLKSYPRHISFPFRGPVYFYAHNCNPSSGSPCKRNSPFPIGAM